MEVWRTATKVDVDPAASTTVSADATDVGIISRVVTSPSAGTGIIRDDLGITNRERSQPDEGKTATASPVSSRGTNPSIAIKTSKPTGTRDVTRDDRLFDDDAATVAVDAATGSADATGARDSRLT